MSKLSHRAMLMTLSISEWKAKAADRAVAVHAEMSQAAEAGSMIVIKELCPKHILQPIKTTASIGRGEHYKMTLPGLVRGQQLLPTAMFEQYMATQRMIREEYFGYVNKFVDSYPDIKKRAKTRLGHSFKETDFPTQERIRNYFDYSFTPSPVPETKDWRLDGVEQSDIDEMRGEVEDSVKRMFINATKEVYAMAQDAMERLIQQAENYIPTVPGAMLRDHTLENIKEIASLIGPMNVTGDPLLDKIGKEMLAKFSNLDGKALRQSEQGRKEIADTAKRVLAQMVAQQKKKAA